MGSMHLRMNNAAFSRLMLTTRGCTAVLKISAFKFNRWKAWEMNTPALSSWRIVLAGPNLDSHCRERVLTRVGQMLWHQRLLRSNVKYLWWVASVLGIYRPFWSVKNASVNKNCNDTTRWHINSPATDTGNYQVKNSHLTTAAWKKIMMAMEWGWWVKKSTNTEWVWICSATNY